MVVYSASFPNNKIYIGCTSKTLSFRQRGHKHKTFTTKSKLPFHCAIRKYGWDNVTWSILFETKDHAELLKKEVELISTMRSVVPFGYNITEGGEGTLGIPGWNKGMTCSFSHIENMRKASTKLMKVTVVIDLELKNIRTFSSVKSASEFLKADYGVIKIARKRNECWFKYKILTEEYFKTLSPDEYFADKPSHNAKKISLEKGSQIKIFDSMNQARKYLNVSERQVRNIVYRNYIIDGWRLI